MRAEDQDLEEAAELPTSSSPLLSGTSRRVKTSSPSLYRRWHLDHLSSALLALIAAIWIFRTIRERTSSNDSTGAGDRGKAWPTYPGWAGPTPTGAEPLAAATAYPVYTDISPLRPPHSLTPNTASSSSSPSSPSSKGFNLLHNLGNLAPWRSVSHGLGDSAQIPPQCTVKQVQLLHRHGARYPTSGHGPADFEQVVRKPGFKAHGELEFLNTWNYSLGAEILTPFGRNQLFSLGVKYRDLYGELLDAPPLQHAPKTKAWHKKNNGNRTRLLFRTETQDRMTKSSLNFAAGFFGIPEFQTDFDLLPMIEWPGFNCTLSPYMTCPNAGDPRLSLGRQKMSEWSSIYLADARIRLQALVQGVELGITDVLNAQMLCAYELVAFGGSPFCELFTEDEWLGFEYLHDIAFWYLYSFGQPAQAALGLGWVQEWLARVTLEPITTFNSTINSSYPFPLDQAIYVDATHDTVISAIITTLGFSTFASQGPPPSTHIPTNRSFIASSISPFAANLHSQIVECPSDFLTAAADESVSEEKALFVRWILNDGVVPLEHEQCSPNTSGFCELDAYVDLLRTSINTIDWAHDCLGSYELGDSPILDGRPSHRSR